MTQPARGVVVVAVGGNALTAADQHGTAAEIEANAQVMARSVAELVRAGHPVVVVHGNGPQVGALSMQQDAAEHVVAVQPLHQLCAMTQGQLGSVLVRALDHELGAGRAVALVTHVVVDPQDPAFGRPTKPIGPFFTEGEAVQHAAMRGWEIAPDAGRGWRRVVASPQPVRVLELEAVRLLLAAGQVVLAGGGGGVAVGPDLAGVDAVIDKDAASAVLAADVGATDLILLTGVDEVLLDFGTSQQRPVHRLSAREAAVHLADGQFPAGSMGPKVEAALAFLTGGGQRAVITSAARMSAAVAGEDGVGTTFSP